MMQFDISNKNWVYSQGHYWAVLYMLVHNNKHVDFHGTHGLLIMF